MAELTKEYFDQQLKERLEEQTKDLKVYTDAQTEALARIVNQAFQQQAEFMDKRFEVIERKLNSLETGQEDIKLRLDQAAWKFEVEALDRRVKVLEGKAGVISEKQMREV